MSTLAHIFQVCYTPELCHQVESGYGVMGDTRNPRPEWYEYWHIRQFLNETSLEDEAFYGFFSPKFKEKTNLSPSQVFGFIASHADADVITFSPYLDNSAFHLNHIEQGRFAHPGLSQALLTVCRDYFDGLDPDTLVTTSENTVFCNYFVAKPAVWRRWLAICEKLFEAIEDENSALRSLLGDVSYQGKKIPPQAFIIERIITLVLATDPAIKVAAHPSYGCAVGKWPIAKSTSLLLSMDALKRSYLQTNSDEYLYAYLDLRLNVWKGMTPPEQRQDPNHAYQLVKHLTANIMHKLSIDKLYPPL